MLVAALVLAYYTYWAATGIYFDVPFFEFV